MTEENVKIFDVRKVRKSPTGDLNRSNFWREKPTQESSPASLNKSSYLTYTFICLTAFSIAALTTILVNVSRSTKPTDQSTNTLSNQTYQSQSKPGEKNPFTVDREEPALTTPTSEISSPNQPESPTIDKKTIRLRILNGSGVTGEAAKTKTDLEAKGYVVSSIGNAKFNYTQTQIYYLTGKNKAADLVAQDLAGKEVKKSEAAVSVVGDNIDVLVVVGKR